MTLTRLSLATTLNRWKWELLILVLLVLFPFVAGIFFGNPADLPPDLRGLARLVHLTETGPAKFWQGMLIQMLILAVFAISYDLLLGYTGILSFGHAMFYGTGGYVIGILLKHFGWPWWAALGIAVLVAILQSLVFGALSLRVRGVYLAMVTLAFSEFFLYSLRSDRFSAVHRCR